VKKLVFLLFILVGLSLATLFAQEEAGKKTELPERVIIGKRWLLVQYPVGNLKLKAWLFIPRGAETSPTPAILRIPAGGNLFKPAALGLGTIPEIEPYVTAGYVTMVMSFRGTMDGRGNFSKSRGGLDDVLGALEYLKKQPEVDRKNIFVAGHSSAASLALRVSQVSEIPRAVAAFSPVTDWSEFFKKRMENVSDETRKFVTDASPLMHADKTKCPVLLTHGTADTIAPESHSKRMNEELKKAEKSCEFVSIPDGDHYFSMLKVSIPLSLAFFSEIREKGKITDLYKKFRDNLLKKFSRPFEPKQE
jgi:dipeptidyl aminopeptidase/acylaminoacyl peptidase